MGTRKKYENTSQEALISQVTVQQKRVRSPPTALVLHKFHIARVKKLDILGRENQNSLLLGSWKKINVLRQHSYKHVASWLVLNLESNIQEFSRVKV